MTHFITEIWFVMPTVEIVKRWLQSWSNMSCLNNFETVAELWPDNHCTGHRPQNKYDLWNVNSIRSWNLSKVTKVLSPLRSHIKSAFSEREQGSLENLVTIYLYKSLTNVVNNLENFHTVCFVMGRNLNLQSSKHYSKTILVVVL